MKQILLV